MNNIAQGVLVVLAIITIGILHFVFRNNGVFNIISLFGSIMFTVYGIILFRSKGKK